LTHAPIVEALLDLDCDLPPTLDFEALRERARQRLAERYPICRTKYSRQVEFPVAPETPNTLRVGDRIEAYGFWQQDEQQLIQLRQQGFSFNRMKPYTTLDDYLAEIERTWGLFVELAEPVMLRTVRLRYLNRILLPLKSGRVKLDDYLHIGPRLPAGKLALSGFLTRFSLLDPDTSFSAQLVLASEQWTEDELPLILDLAVTAAVSLPVDAATWSTIRPTLDSLRVFKNDLFYRSLTERCLNLFK